MLGDATHGFADLHSSTPTPQSSTTLPTAVILAVELRDLRLPRDGIPVRAPLL